MILTPAQSQIASDAHRFRVVNCGRRFGKTTLSVEEVKGLVLVDRDRRIEKMDLTEAERNKVLSISERDEYRCRVNYWAETYRDARDIAWGIFLTELKSIITKVNEQRLEITVRNIEGKKALIRLRGWESVESARGTKSDYDIFDEVAKYKSFWMYWQEVIYPTLTDYAGMASFYSTPRGFNHFYDLYNLEAKDKDFKSFHFTSYDNPFLLKKEIDKAREKLTEDRFAQEYLADFRKTEGLVYKEFDRSRHLVSGEVPKNFVDTILGIDFGYTNPSSIIPIKVDGDNHYWILEEFYKTGQTTEQIAEQARLYKPTKVYADPAEPDRIEILNRSGLNCREVSKDIVAGVDRVRELFKQGRIHISASCKNLIHELETYRYPDKKPDKNEEEKPVKENDHALDALRYALYMTEPVIQSIPDPYFDTYGTYYRD